MVTDGHGALDNLSVDEFMPAVGGGDGEEVFHRRRRLLSWGLSEGHRQRLARIGTQF